MMRKCLFKFVAVAMMAATVISCSSDDDSEPTAFGKGTATAKIAGVKRKVNWVQLWQDGPRFAEFNVGATAIYEYGGYFVWGGLYYESTEEASSLNNDIANQIWGNNWRMPTAAEMTDLVNNCTTIKTNNYLFTGFDGYLFTGKGDYANNSIFLPAAGYYSTSQGIIDVARDGCYWTSDEHLALCFRVTNSQIPHIGHFNTKSAYSVRAVLK